MPHNLQPEAFERSLNGEVMAKLGDRWGILGTTGTGKTRFARGDDNSLGLLTSLMRAYPYGRFYVIDSKWRGGDFEKWPGIVRDSVVPDPLHQPGVLVWQTPRDEPEAYGEFIDRVLLAGKPAFIWIDELSSLGRGRADTYPPQLGKALKQGRGLHIGMGIATQEAAYIPRTILGQLTHLVRFGLEDEFDAKRIDKKLLRPIGEWGKDPPKYSFYYRKLEAGQQPHLFDDYRSFFS